MSEPRRGALITIDGVEGAGKSTQSVRLGEALKRLGHEVVVTREPGGTELGRALRELLLSDSLSPPTRETELLLYLADRAEHVRRFIEPALVRGALVIVDRFCDSTLAYQAHGRGLPVATVRELDAFARGGLAPNLTFVLDLPPEEGLARAKARSAADRFEREDLAFHRRVRDGFLAISAAEPERVVVLDGRLQVEDLCARMVELVRARLVPQAEPQP